MRDIRMRLYQVKVRFTPCNIVATLRQSDNHPFLSKLLADSRSVELKRILQTWPALTVTVQGSYSDMCDDSHAGNSTTVTQDV